MINKKTTLPTKKSLGCCRDYLKSKSVLCLLSQEISIVSPLENFKKMMKTRQTVFIFAHTYSEAGADAKEAEEEDEDRQRHVS